MSLQRDTVEFFANEKLTQEHILFHHTNRFFEEIQLCAPLEHRNVIDCLGGCWGEAGFGSGVAIVFELASRGDLGNFIGKGWAVTSWLCLGTARAMEYLHSRKVSLMHRDL